MTKRLSRLKIIWFVVKTFFKGYVWSYTYGKNEVSYNITDEKGNYQYLRFVEGNNCD